MTRLTDDLLLDLVDRTYEAALDPAQWRRLLGDLSTNLSTNCGLISQSRTSAILVWNDGGFDPLYAASYEAYYSRRKPWLDKFPALALDQVFGLEWLVDESVYRRSEYLNDWLRPQGQYYLLGGLVDRHGTEETVLSMMRPKQIDNFTATERQFCRRLLPHIRRALAVHRRLSATAQPQQGLLEAFERLGTGVIAVGTSGEIVFSNAAAETILRRGDVLYSRAGRLRARRRADADDLLGQIGRAATHASALRGEPIIVLPHADGGGLSILVVPFPPDQTFQLGTNRPTALLFLTDSRAEAGVRRADLARLYGLTPAEADLLAALLQGSTLQHYATTTRVTLNTVRTHLKQIFVKTGHNRQADLIRAVLSNPVVRLAAG